MKFFIALELSEENKQQLWDVQQQLKLIIPDAKIIRNENLHLTIAFVGEQPADLQARLSQVMAEASQEIPPFEVTPSYIDGFPHLHSARILWVGVKDDIDKLYLLRHRIKDGLESLNLAADERRYVPHIAVAKLKPDFQLVKDQEEALVKLMSKPFTPIEVSSVKLFESIPNHSFHQHNTLAEIKLK